MPILIDSKLKQNFQTWNLDNLALKIRGDKMSEDNVNKSDVTQNSKFVALRTTINLFYFFYGLLKNIFVFALGIFIGMGIVLTNPPQDKRSREVISVLEKQNKDLKNDLNFYKDKKSVDDCFSKVQNGLVIGK